MIKHQDGKFMVSRNKIIFTIIVASMVCFPIMSLGRNCNDYKNTTDKLKAKILFDNKLHLTGVSEYILYGNKSIKASSIM